MSDLIVKYPFYFSSYPTYIISEDENDISIDWNRIYVQVESQGAKLKTRITYLSKNHRIQLICNTPEVHRIKEIYLKSKEITENPKNSDLIEEGNFISKFMLKVIDNIIMETLPESTPRHYTIILEYLTETNLDIDRAFTFQSMLRTIDKIIRAIIPESNFPHTDQLFFMWGQSSINRKDVDERLAKILPFGLSIEATTLPNRPKENGITDLILEYLNELNLDIDSRLTFPYINAIHKILRTIIPENRNMDIPNGLPILEAFTHIYESGGLIASAPHVSDKAQKIDALIEKEADQATSLIPSPQNLEEWAKIKLEEIDQGSSPSYFEDLLKIIDDFLRKLWDVISQELLFILEDLKNCLCPQHQEEQVAVSYCAKRP